MPGSGGGTAAGRLSIAICARCGMKHPYMALMSDPNSPGLRVCKDDLDDFDPWRLPAIKPEAIALRFPRPDVSIATNPSGLITDDQASFIIAPNGNYIVGS